MRDREKNLAVLVCDSLRYDVVPLLDLDLDYEMRLIKSWTDQTATLPSLATILTGEKYNEEDLKPEKRLKRDTFMDFFKDSEFYASLGPSNLDPESKKKTMPYILGMKGLEDERLRGPNELETPYCFFRPLEDLHVQYRHKREAKRCQDGFMYTMDLKDYYERYYVALGKIRKEIDSWMDRFDGDTQVIITSDHGELFPDEMEELTEEEYGNRSEWAHGIDHPRVNTVPIITIPEWKELPDEMNHIEIYSWIKERWDR